MLFKLLERFWIVNPTIGLFVGGGGGRTAAYQITNSVRLDSARSSRLSRTFASAGGNTWTLSCWIKKCATSGAASQVLLGEGATATNNAIWHQWSTADTVGVSNSVGTALCTSTAKFRDPTGWYHFCVKNTAGTVTFYVNNVAVATAAGTVNINTNAAHYIGCGAGTSYFADIYLADLYFIDGQALSPSSFAMEDTNGVWIPKAWSGTYGSNGCHLDFKNATSTTTLGYDVSGNANHWTPGGSISVTAGINYDSMVDTPTNNYATLNPIQPRGGNFATTLSDGALSYASAVGASFPRAYSTIPLAEAGSYFEFTCIAGDTAGPYFGISSSDTLQTPTSGGLGFGANEYGYQSSTGVFRNNNSTLATYATFTTGDVIAIAYKNGSLWIAKNNTWLNSGNPDSNTGAVATGLSTTTKWLAACATNNSGTKVAALNAGQQPWSTATSTARTTAATFGALCTANLPPVAITNPKLHLDAKTWAGNASYPRQVVTGTAFSPDLVWGKNRTTSGYDNVLYDVVRGFGTGKALSSNLTDVEGLGAGHQDSNYGWVSAANSDGFTVQTGAINGRNWNGSGENYVSWLWKAGGAPTTDNVAGAGNTPTAGSVKIDGANLGSALAGSIAATRLSANTTAGFSVVTYTGTGANATVAHGLGVAPKMVITRCRNYGSARNWSVWHSGIANTEFLNLNGTDAKATDATMWNSTSPTTSVFSVGSNADSNLNTYTFVAYCFAEVPGYSKFGSYVGNAAADGPFVYCGFRPKYLLIKTSVSAANAWYIHDAARDTYNQMNHKLYPDVSTAENTAADNMIDFTANGFKVRSANTSTNDTNTMIFAAFAEFPFGGSNVAPSPAR